MGNKVDNVKNRFQNAILMAPDSFVTLKLELAFGSRKASSGGDKNSVPANSERGERIENTVVFQNVSEENNTLHVLNMNEEARNSLLEEVSESSVPGIQFHRQQHTHHNKNVSCNR